MDLVGRGVICNAGARAQRRRLVTCYLACTWSGISTGAQTQAHTQLEDVSAGYSATRTHTADGQITTGPRQRFGNVVVDHCQIRLEDVLLEFRIRGAKSLRKGRPRAPCSMQLRCPRAIDADKAVRLHDLVASITLGLLLYR